jgi:Winged helix-turn-helix DNA-binding
VSVIDRFEEELIARLRELRPLATEYHQLEQVARRLGLDLDEGRTPPARKRQSSRKTTPTQRISATAAQSAPIGRASAATLQTSATSTGQRRGRASSSSTDERRASRQRRSRRQQDVLRLIQERPGITVKQIGTELDVDATNLYRHVRRLQQDGLITKHGTALQPNGR